MEQTPHTPEAKHFKILKKKKIIGKKDQRSSALYESTLWTSSIFTTIRHFLVKGQHLYLDVRIPDQKHMMWCLWLQALLCLDSGSGSSIVAGIWSIICGICREKQFERCFVDESDGAKTGWPSEGGPFYPQDLRGISNSPLQFLSNVSHSVKEWQLNLLKRQIMPFRKWKATFCYWEWRKTAKQRSTLISQIWISFLKTLRFS